jgi:2,4'-dihydroxyacetophenone dioxygenase
MSNKPNQKPNQSNLTPPADTLFTCHPQDMQWLPWAMPGAHFKLLHANATTGHFTLLIRFEAGAVAPIHRHVGAVEGYMIEGGFYYHDEPERPFNAGCYLWENEGAIHQPVSPNGNVIGRINWKWHVEKWNAAGNHYQPSV